jgi:hypothetical protein
MYAGLLNSGNVYGVNERCTPKHKRRESTPQHKKTTLHENNPSVARFSRYGVLMIKGNAQSGHLKVQRWILKV